MTDLLSSVGIILEGDWSSRDIRVTAMAVISVGNALSEAGKGQNWMDAFRNVYGSANSPIRLKWVGSPANTPCGYLTDGGCTDGTQSIYGIALCNNSGEICGRGNMVHEFGHLLYNRWGNGHYVSTTYTDNRSSIFRENGPSYAGSTYWQFGHSNTSQEVWADLFVAWTFNVWNDDVDEAGSRASAARDWMSADMATWLNK